MFAADFMIGRAGTLKILELNSFPNFATQNPNPKKLNIYAEVLSKASEIIARKVKGTEMKLLEGVIKNG